MPRTKPPAVGTLDFIEREPSEQKSFVRRILNRLWQACLYVSEFVRHHPIVTAALLLGLISLAVVFLFPPAIPAITALLINFSFPLFGTVIAPFAFLAGLSTAAATTIVAIGVFAASLAASAIVLNVINTVYNLFRFALSSDGSSKDGFSLYKCCCFIRPNPKSQPQQELSDQQEFSDQQHGSVLQPSAYKARGSRPANAHSDDAHPADPLFDDYSPSYYP